MREKLTPGWDKKSRRLIGIVNVLTPIAGISLMAGLTLAAAAPKLLVTDLVCVFAYGMMLIDAIIFNSAYKSRELELASAGCTEEEIRRFINAEMEMNL